MFIESSRYYKEKTVTCKTSSRQPCKAVKLRRIPALIGDDYSVLGTDRLDIMAHRKYGNATQFWHIADANSFLESNYLIKETGRSIKLPNK